MKRLLLAGLLALHCSTRTLTVERLRLSKGTPAFRVTRPERTSRVGVPSLRKISQPGAPQHTVSFTTALLLAPEAASSRRSQSNTPMRLLGDGYQHFDGADTCLEPPQKFGYNRDKAAASNGVAQIRHCKSDAREKSKIEDV